MVFIRRSKIVWIVLGSLEGSCASPGWVQRDVKCVPACLATAAPSTLQLTLPATSCPTRWDTPGLSPTVPACGFILTSGDKAKSQLRKNQAVLWQNKELEMDDNKVVFFFLQRWRVIARLLVETSCGFNFDKFTLLQHCPATINNI